MLEEKRKGEGLRMKRFIRITLLMACYATSVAAKGEGYVKLVDPFWGNGKTATPESQGWARGWNWLKAQMGNTIPGALTPFGWVSVCAYTGNYPCGYGLLKCCSEGAPAYADKEMVSLGFTHFHHCGTGFAGRFYNYFLFAPGEEGTDVTKFSRLVDEKATPGHYSATLLDRNCSFEVTSRPNAACHRYRFPSGKGRICVDVKHVGVRQKAGCGKRGVEKCEGSRIRKISAERWSGTVRFHQLNFHFSILAKAKSVKSSEENGVITFEVEGCDAETFIGLSLVNGQTADKKLAEAVSVGFDGSRREAELKWEKALSRIRARFADEALARRFYTTLYFSFVKPMDTEIGFLDYFTIWDVYRTQLPLVLSLWPKTAHRMMEDMMAVSEKHGFYPISRNMTGHRLGRRNGQAVALPVYVMSDAFFRNVLSKEDWPRVKKFFVDQLTGTVYKCSSPSYTLDYAGANRAAQYVAEQCGDHGYAKELDREVGVWRNVYNPGTGYLVNTGRVFYYEGNYRNYSFRAHAKMGDRISLAGGTDRFLAMLDDFFQVDHVPYQWDGKRDRSRRDGYFEGLTNQTDMETPFTYIWCGRPDRTAAVIDLVRRYRFADGQGGCPGNNDSGATSSWYVWSCLGLYPLSGTPYYLIGSPSVESAEIDFPGGVLKIETERESKESIYPVDYAFNGKRFREPWIPVVELEKGGRLLIRLSDKPAPAAPVPKWLD